MINIKALQLASRFSLTPNILGYCGRESAGRKFKNCIIHGNCHEVEEELKKFIVLYPYLKTISKISGLPVFSYPVIESYWFGNNLLKKVNIEHYQILIDNFVKQGVPDFLIKQLQKKQPKKFIPHHLFQVIYVGVGQASGSVPFNTQSINNCMIRWGKIIKVNKKTANVDVIYLSEIKNKYIIKNKIEKIAYDNKIIPGLKKGIDVAVHWQQIVKILTPGEEKNLKYWTNQIFSYCFFECN
jgi:hypothetical protein